MIRILLLLCLLAGLSLFAPGCVSIMQWQRQYLGDPIMKYNHDQNENSLKDHIYPRREGSSGGTGSSGGGCGC
jgi:hypothetical protein